MDICVMIARMETKIFEIQTEKLNKNERPLRIVMLSDLHNRLWGKGQNQLLEAIDALRGDMVLCAGDMLVGREQAGSEHAVALFKGLSERRIPAIAGNGNHESRMRQQLSVYGRQYHQYKAQLEALGIRVLENETVCMEYGSMKICIHGYEMPLKYYRKFCSLPYDIQDLQRHFGNPGKDAYHILLAHNPVYFEQYARWGADLTLSGHLHGGIIRIPGIGGLITPQARLFPRYDRGLFEKDGKYMVVSPGLGEHTVPIRIFNPPQLIGIVIKGTGEDGIIRKD